MRVDAPRLKHAAQALAEAVKALPQQPDAGALRGAEGAAAALYFDVFDELILQNKQHFFLSLIHI